MEDAARAFKSALRAAPEMVAARKRLDLLPKDIVSRADVLIAAVGKPRFVQGDWVKPGSIIVDAGYNEGNIGDVDFDGAIDKVSLITPVPGGVGPMTIATLLDQTADAAAKQLGVEI